MRFKIPMVLLLAAMLLFSFVACSMGEADDGLAATEETTKNSSNQTTDDSTVANEGEITKEEAEKIALEHAGFTADSVLRLHTEYEMDDGVPEYDVQFDKDGWEYDYTIHGKTGAVLSYDKDKD